MSHKLLYLSPCYICHSCLSHMSHHCSLIINTLSLSIFFVKCRVKMSNMVGVDLPLFVFMYVTEKSRVVADDALYYDNLTSSLRYIDLIYLNSDDIMSLSGCTIQASLPLFWQNFNKHQLVLGRPDATTSDYLL